MRRSGHIPWGQLKVGGLIIAAFMLFLWTSFKIPGPKVLSRKHNAWVYVHDVNGMVSGSPVRIGGVPIGTVSKLDFTKFDKERVVGVQVELGAEHWKLLHKDATATMGTVGLLGDMYVAIDPGSQSAPALEENGIIPLRDVPTIASLAPRMSAFLDTLQETVQITNHLLAGLEAGRGTFGAMVTKTDLHDSMVRLADAGAASATRLSRDADQLLPRLTQLSDDFDELVKMAKSPKSTTGAMLSDRSLFDAATRTAARLDSLTDALQKRGGGTAGALLRDEQLYARTTTTLATVDSLIVEIQKHPNRFFKFSVF